MRPPRRPHVIESPGAEGHLHVDIQELADELSAGVRGLQVRSVDLIGEGMDNVAYEINGELVVRLSKEPDPTRRAERIDAEAKLLAAVANISPLPVPEPLFTDPGRGCLAYAKIPGVPLLALPLPQRLAHAPVAAAALGRFLAALHAAPLEQMAQFVSRDEVPMAEWRDEAALDYAAVIRAIPAALPAALTAYQAGDTAGLGERAAFYARCGLLEDLAYGSQTGLNVYTDNSLAALRWLFPA